MEGSSSQDLRGLTVEVHNGELTFTITVTDLSWPDGSIREQGFGFAIRVSGSHQHEAWLYPDRTVTQTASQPYPLAAIVLEMGTPGRITFRLPDLAGYAIGQSAAFDAWSMTPLGLVSPAPLREVTPIVGLTRTADDFTDPPHVTIRDC